MLWLQLLPLILVAVTFNVVHAATSPNDPFRALALQIPKQPEQPICCLKPQQTLEPIEDEILLSFEEWKQQQGDVINRTADTNDSDAPAPVHANDVPAAPHAEETQKPPPHFRVPITDRFNYASMECSARVHLAHRGAKSTSAILSSKRDRYMLSPCEAKNQFVVVELCEDIRIDTIQLANFEFFSGIFKDFKLSVSKTYVTGEDAFIDAGVFRAKNVRGVQSFHPPTSLRDFYRYIRIDFISHYGNEFYCPASLLRVYGLTHLEQWKWDTWEQESRERAEVSKIEAPTKQESTSILEVETSTEVITPTTVSSLRESPEETNIPEPVVVVSDKAELVPALETFPAEAEAEVQQDPRQTPPPPFSAPNTIAGSTSVSSSVASPTDSPSSLPKPTSSTFYAIDSQKPHHPEVTPISSSTKALSTTSSVAKPTSTSSIKPTSTTTTSSTHVAASAAPGGESIYRTIMNRLTALEANHTLYVRYVEQQTSGVREVLRRIGEDVGRLEGFVRAEGHSNQRALKAAELRTQMELGELMRRVDVLADEIVLEKRLGVAQLCLLAAVLVFMGLTRGSRGDAPSVVGGRARKLSMREWGRRHLSLSGDWSRFGSRGRKEERQVEGEEQVPSAQGLNQDAKVVFPSKDSVPATEQPTRTRPKSGVAIDPVVRSISSDSRAPQSWYGPRSRTPSMRSRQQHQHSHSHSQHIHHPVPRYAIPTTPTRLRMPMAMPLQRSNSHTNALPGGTPAMHRSARRWARTAHLHEVRSVQRTRRAVVSDENDSGAMGRGAEDPFWDEPEPEQPQRPLKAVGKENENEVEGDMDRRRPVSFEGDGDAWVDTDTDLEESDEGTEGWTQTVPSNTTNFDPRRPPPGNEH
ncbi:hypothetical protein DXG01_001231 [Tephrocybe rancida]|nr:hypothetical protein DXG01_001231 [Tephrocybe rancida]